jgi:hypothetical protein
MNKIQAKINQIAPYVNSATPKSVKNEAFKDLRTEILSDYRIFTDESPTVKSETPAKSETPVKPEEQTG